MNKNQIDHKITEINSNLKQNTKSTQIIFAIQLTIITINTILVLYLINNMLETNTTQIQEYNIPNKEFTDSFCISKGYDSGIVDNLICETGSIKCFKGNTNTGLKTECFNGEYK